MWVIHVFQEKSKIGIKTPKHEIDLIKVLDAEELSTRQAGARTGIAHSEFVRIRNVNLGRFTIDRLVTILGRLGQEVEFSFTVHPRSRREVEPDTAHL